MQTVLRIDDLHKMYGAQVALGGVSLAIPEGRIVGLLGPNGSGKTTMIKIICGLLHDYEGDVQICGYTPGVESKRLVSYLPDKMTLPAWLKVYESLGIYNGFYEDFDPQKARKLLDQLEVPEHKRIGELSKGMQEKLQLVLAISRQARLYVLDEPIAGVDPASRDVILSIIMDNFAHGASILLSTHIISDVETVFDDVIFLKEGRIHLQGDAETLRQEHGQSIDGLFREVYKC